LLLRLPIRLQATDIAVAAAAAATAIDSATSIARAILPGAIATGTDTPTANVSASFTAITAITAAAAAAADDDDDEPD